VNAECWRLLVVNVGSISRGRRGGRQLVMLAGSR